MRRALRLTVSAPVSRIVGRRVYLGSADGQGTLEVGFNINERPFHPAAAVVLLLRLPRHGRGRREGRAPAAVVREQARLLQMDERTPPAREGGKGEQRMTSMTKDMEVIARMELETVPGEIQRTVGHPIVLAGTDRGPSMKRVLYAPAAVNLYKKKLGGREFWIANCLVPGSYWLRLVATDGVRVHVQEWQALWHAEKEALAA